MIFFLADGRLGNQIFQFAFLKTIAKKNETIFCVNMKKLFETFDINANNIVNVNGRYSIFLIRKFIIPYLLIPLSNLRLFGNIKQNLSENNTPQNGFVTQTGLLPFQFVYTNFFQSDSFYDAKIFDSEVVIKNQYLQEAKVFLSNIPHESNKVFIHVRRGDYTNEIFLGVRGIDLPKRYFDKAILLIKEAVKNPFFVFLSDDPSYVEDCFGGIEPKIISRNSIKTDLAIMSMCDAAVISNSSFSWWGAALMKRPTLIVAPKYWYGWKQKIDSHPFIYPSGSCLIVVDE